MTPAFSILMAAYNAERYIGEALDSLQRQTFADFEALCVDDGSTDGTWDILQSRAAGDSRFKVFRLGENGGQARARNFALERAVGEYVAFLDADDFYADDALQLLHDAFRESVDTDCVLFDVVYCSEDGRSGNHYGGISFNCITGAEAFEYALPWKIHGVYAVRAGIHRRIPYLDDLPAYSDDKTTYLHYLESRKVRSSTAAYFYRDNPGSVTRKVSAARFNWLASSLHFKGLLEEMGMPERIRSIWERELWLVLVGCYKFLCDNGGAFTEKEGREALALIKEAWRGMDFQRLPATLKCKPGYMPMKGCWPLFSLQARLYFMAKRVLGRG